MRQDRQSFRNVCASNAKQLTRRVVDQCVCMRSFARIGIGFSTRALPNFMTDRAIMLVTVLARWIPIITVSADPVSTGFVTSLARPGANVTGLAIMHTELSSKRLEILTQVLPTARRIALPGLYGAPALHQFDRLQKRAGDP